jgi:hypothetical protein
LEAAWQQAQQQPVWRTVAVRSPWGRSRPGASGFLRQQQRRQHYYTRCCSLAAVCCGALLRVQCKHSSTWRVPVSL